MTADQRLRSPQSTTLGVLPSGTIGLVEIAAGLSPARKGITAEQTLPQELRDALTQSLAGGLTLLSSSEWKLGLTPVTTFWRHFGRLYFQALCRQVSQASDQWSSPDAPDDETLNQLIRSAPPMVGLEYLDPESLKRLWEELDKHTRENVASQRKRPKAKKGENDLAGYLHSLDPAWNLVGRVTFHLAENKKKRSQAKTSNTTVSWRKKTPKKSVTRKSTKNSGKTTSRTEVAAQRKKAKAKKATRKRRAK